MEKRKRHRNTTQTGWGGEGTCRARLFHMRGAAPLSREGLARGGWLREAGLKSFGSDGRRRRRDVFFVLFCFFEKEERSGGGLCDLISRAG